MLTLDHIAIAASDLAAGARAVETALNVRLSPGGAHAEMGTHNRLLSLGPDEYLEVIAIDPDGTAPAHPRWFGLDRFAGKARTRAWVCRCPDLDAAIAAAPPGVGAPRELARDGLAWRMAVPATGLLPFDGLFPALIAWRGAAHPAPSLPDAGARLRGLRLHAPRADDLRAALSGLIDDPRISVETSDTPRIEAVLRAPAGDVVL